MAVDVDLKTIQKGVDRLIKRFGSGDFVVRSLDLIAEELLNLAINVIPTDQATLERSGTTSVNSQKKEVVFGFNTVYAAFQDAPGRSTPYIVKPRIKRALYIPLNRRGRSHRIGNNPNDEGLTYGVDYVLKKQVTIPIKPYGSPIGPNHYFSGTIERNVDFALSSLAKRLRERLESES